MPDPLDRTEPPSPPGPAGAPSPEVRHGAAEGTGPVRDPGEVSVPVVCLAGTAVWLVVLVVTLAVPSLHTGDRSWWPWTAVVGMVLGLSGWLYVRRGRGNAASA